MSHLDEGTLHALLDGELEITEVAEIQAHLGSCSACGLRLREVKEFRVEADRLIASVNLGAQPVGAPASTAAPAVASARETATRAEPIERPAPPARREPAVRPRPATDAPPREPWNEPPPMLFIPDNESPAERRMHRLRRMGWAAMIVGLVGAGFVGTLLRPHPVSGPTPGSSARTEADAVVSPEETGRPEQVATQTGASTSPAAAKSPAGPAVPARRANEPRQAKATPRADRQAPDRQAPQSQAPDQQATDRQAAERQLGAGPDSQTIDSLAETAADGKLADSSATEDIATVRARAGEALAELDRERRRNQAAAATAALDSERRRNRGAAPVTAAPAPAPPTVEQRAQVYLRIGLDEASRQLGGPVHVIEGLSPLFMGLVRGPAVGGADATRPVVRVAYQDSQGRLILLDQQRLRAGQTPPPTSALSWTLGETAMWLHGEASADILRTYRPRVR